MRALSACFVGDTHMLAPILLLQGLACDQLLLLLR
jgi:hypothetical protein